jgi:carbon-monoxide dehydrogenase medium subunit/6-hydroxypseudooxynicotine dehydrogenase subunit alpha
MKLPPFTLTRAESVDHAVATLGELGPDAKVLAGGQSLIPLMSLRLAAPSHLLDVSDLRELSYVGDDGAVLSVGGTTTHAAFERESRRLGPSWQAVRDALPLIGHLPIRTRGTIGGSLAHADATAELPLLAQTLDAEIVAASRQGRRTVPAADFFKGIMTTELEPHELIVEIRFPHPPAGARSAFEEFSERAGDFAFASVCAVIAPDEAGVCRWARVGLGAVGPVPVRSRGAEATLVGARLDEATIESAAEAVLGEIHPRGGLHVSAEFRAELVATMLRRALRRLANETGVP